MWCGALRCSVLYSIARGAAICDEVERRVKKKRLNRKGVED